MIAKIYSNLIIFKCFLICVIFAVMTACSDSEESIIQNVSNFEVSHPKSRSLNNADEQAKKKAKESFAKILSRATHDYQGVRELLKTKASAYFDMNSDVLYALIKHNRIGNRTFREILLDYTSETELLEIETTVPLLNILIPKIEMFDISPENMDCSDKEIPVAISNEDGMSIYINGQLETVVESGNIPNFHTFVVNENSRVAEIKEPSRGEDGILFISPNYDRRNQNIESTSLYDPYSAGVRAVQAFTYFNGHENDNYSYALQRDYIYYGMTPDSVRGNFNHGITEYIKDFEVNPLAYFNISDQVNGGIFTDPVLIKNEVTRKGKQYTMDKLLEKFWAEGAYNFRFEILYSNNSLPTIIYIPLTPQDLWNFNIDTSVRKGNIFRPKKYFYKIDPLKFTAKRVPISGKISLGKWDLSKEGTERYIRIFEEDKSQTVKETIEYEVTKMNSTKINGSVKLGLGTDLVSGNISTDVNTSTSTKETRKYEITRQEEDDALGTIKIYFYDPIIIGRYGLHYFDLHEYNTGVVKFSITADYM